MASGTALLVMDMQRDFLEQGGRMPISTPDPQRLIEAANRCIAAASSLGYPVIAIVNEFPRNDWRNVFRRGAAIVGTPGSEPDPRIMPVATERFSKARGDAFTNPALDERLRSLGISTLFICGVYAEACVLATTKGARSRGYAVTVISDAVGSASSASIERAARKYRALGANLASSAEFGASL